LLLALSAVPALAWAYWLLRRRPCWLLPPQRRRAVPWQGAQVSALAFALLLLCPFLAQTVLVATPLLKHLYGSDFFEAVERREEYAVARFQVWTAVLAFPLSLAAVAAFMKLSGARPYQLGLAGRHVGRDAFLGVLGALALTPAVQVLNFGVSLLWRDYVASPRPHPVTEITQTQPQAIDWVLIFGSAMIAAPVLEELLFRGVLQTWFSSRPHGGDVAVGCAVTIAAYFVAIPVYQATELRTGLIALAPFLFAVGMVLPYLLLRRLVRSPAANGIYGAALLFGIFHSSAWPTPIALFVLAVGLGLLYYRTQSLVPSIVTHALFNAVSFVELVIEAVRRAKGE
jgi:membrane protease YdiL (CAAX protease family)